MNNIKFSIITVTLNAEKSLGITLSSVLSQTYKNFELIIKDGLSSDNTCEVIPSDKRIKLIQRKDGSVYEGMNQAIEVSQGNFLIFMNAGDAFYDDYVIEDIAEYIEKRNLPDNVVIYGDYIREGIVYKQSKKLNELNFYRRNLCHQSIFYSRDVLQKYNGYNLKYKICADFELTLRLWSKRVKFFHIDRVICKYLGGGLSETKQNLQIAKSEKSQILNEYFSGIKYKIIAFLFFDLIPRLKRKFHI